MNLINKIITKIQNNIHFRKRRNETLQLAKNLFPNKIVYGGPFKGLKYIDYKAYGSSIYAKLLGTYEAELHKFISLMFKKDLDFLIDIGCAEGYYAVGFALKNKNILVYAFDISKSAQNLCLDMARFNKVASRVKVSGEIDKNYFLKLPKKKKGLIIMDCEGAEADLLDKEVLNYLSNYNFIIELHEFIIRGIEKKLINIMKETHTIKIINSVDDYRRPDKWPLAILEGINFIDQKELYKEFRPGLMKWICAVPKNNSFY